MKILQMKVEYDNFAEYEIDKENRKLEGLKPGDTIQFKNSKIIITYKQ